MARFLVLFFAFSISLAAEKACSGAGTEGENVLTEYSVVGSSALGETSGLSAINNAKTEETTSPSAPNGSGDSTGRLEDNKNFPIFLQSKAAEDITTSCIEAHNEKRVGKLKHPLPPVNYDPYAAAHALKYAEEVVAKKCPFTNSFTPGLGENIYGATGKEATCEGAVKFWYEEYELFKGFYPATHWTLETAHFTQLMWTSSTGIGCARTLQCKPMQILICNYSPRGNLDGQAPFSEEVWESILEVSKSSSTSPITSFTCIFIAIVTAVISLSSSLV